jgi:A/G-specific adenine glycosylase
LAHGTNGSATDPYDGTPAGIDRSGPGTGSQRGDEALADRLRALRDDLLTWFRAEQRDLPWRATRDPYRVLVSEVMLQQTQAARVEPAYRAFLARFPTVEALAAAPTADVVEQWRGLGYNRRAVNLQRAARAVVAEHGGRLPADLDALLALPGVGPYTARAVLAFAFEQPVAAVDVNVARVVQRAVTGRATSPKQRQTEADALVAGAPWELAQALIELGARHCAARRPRCATCPVASGCAWQRTGNRAPDPGASTVTPPAPFAGSDRFHRGRLLDALRAGPVAAGDLRAAARTDEPDRATRLADGLVRDGLATWVGGTLTLPERPGGAVPHGPWGTGATTPDQVGGTS